MQNSGTSVGIAVGVGLTLYLAFLAGLIALAVRWSRNLLQRKSAALATGLEGAGARLVGQGAQAGLYRGRESEYEFEGRRVFVNAYYVSRSYVRANLRVPTAPLPWVTLYPEGAAQRFGKALGISREVSIGDDAFDRAVYIDAAEKNDDHVRALLAPRAVIEAVRELLSLGCKVQFSPRGVEAFQVVYSMTPVNGATSARAASLLLRIADHVPRFDPAALTPWRGGRSGAAGALVVGALVACMVLAGAASAAVGGNVLDGADVGKAILLGGGLWVVYVIGLVVAVRGTASAMTRLVAGAFIGLFAVPFGGGMLLVTLNQALDASPAEVHPVTILRMHHKQHDLHVGSWRPGHVEERLRTSHAVFQTLHPGDRVLVRAHPGRFGWPWIEPVTGRAP